MLLKFRIPSLLFFVVLFGYSTRSIAVSPSAIEIKDSKQEHMFLYNDLEYLEDNGYSIDEVSKGNTLEKFKANTLFAPHNFNIKKAYWIKIRIKGNPSSSKKWLLEFFDQTTDFIEAYIPDGNGKFIRKVAGDQLPFRERQYMHKNFEFEVPNNTSSAQDYFFKVKSTNHVNIIIVLRSIEHFIFYALNEYFLFGIFYGMILIVAVYNLLMYLAIREVQYLSYILFVGSLAIYFMCLDGIAYQYLWPSYPEWNNIAMLFFAFSGVFWLLIFTKQFLHLKSQSPVLNKIINYTLVVRTLIFIIAFFVPALRDYRIIDVIALLITFFTGIYCFVNNYKPARFFVMAYGLLFLGFIARILINLDVDFIPASIVSHYSINLSFVFQMWLLSFALGDKVRIINQTKNKALEDIIEQHEINQELKDKVNRELEGEVQKRTREINEQKKVIELQNRELQIANERLKQQGEEINKINSQLDKDNFSLKNSIKEKMLERAANKNMEFYELKVIFPDDLACLRYLEREKWKHGFSCKKCRNDKFITGKTVFDRRCTRCGYIESPTAFTVFHGVKFSLQKAFYILHLIITERDDITLEELSKILELRKNTCWSFKNKVTKLIERNKWEKEYYEHWENVIFYYDKEQLKVMVND